MTENKPSILVLIPARSGSKGLPGKNIRSLCGRPLIGWPIQAGLGLSHDVTVMVSTDTQEIADVATEQGAIVPFLRPAELASDTAKTIDVITHCLEWFKEQDKTFDFLILLEPTSPLTESYDIEAGLATLMNNLDRAQSIVGVVEHDSTHPEFSVKMQNDLIVPLNGGTFASVKRRQEIDDVYFLDGSFYISTVQAIHNYGTFYHEKTLGYVMPKYKSFEVDDLVDFLCVEAMMNNKNLLEGSR